MACYAELRNLFHVSWPFFCKFSHESGIFVSKWLNVSHQRERGVSLSGFGWPTHAKRFARFMRNTPFQQNPKGYQNGWLSRWQAFWITKIGPHLSVWVSLCGPIRATPFASRTRIANIPRASTAPNWVADPQFRLGIDSELNFAFLF